MNELNKTCKSSPPITLHALLDSDYLFEFYDSDIEDMLWAMETFCKVTIRDFPKLLSFAIKNCWQEVKALAHQLKPNFKLVGLSTIYEELLLLEIHDYSKTNNFDTILTRIHDLIDKLYQTYLPILEIEMTKLTAFLKK